jgi:hypothetical protein
MDDYIFVSELVKANPKLRPLASSAHGYDKILDAAKMIANIEGSFSADSDFPRINELLKEVANAWEKVAEEPIK